MPQRSTSHAPIGRVPPLAKTGTRRISEVRIQGRSIAASLLARVVGEEGERVAHVAQLLGVSRALVRAWCDPDAKQQFPVGDLLALRLVGSEAVVHAYASEVSRWLDSTLRAGRSPAEHIAEIAQATGAVAAALSASDGRVVKIRALRHLKLRVTAALADVEAMPPSSRAAGA